eukprot:365574-Chlamydomonas_euryale.AAC.25
MPLAVAVVMACLLPAASRILRLAGCVSPVVAAALMACLLASASGLSVRDDQIVDEHGNPLKLVGANWFGFNNNAGMVRGGRWRRTRVAEYSTRTGHMRPSSTGRACGSKAGVKAYQHGSGAVGQELLSALARRCRHPCGEALIKGGLPAQVPACEAREGSARMAKFGGKGRGWQG